MNDLIEKTGEFINTYARGKKVAIGVSGGRDSMCLLHAVTDCGSIDKQNMLVVHVNHMLRDTADRDENLVRRFCASLGVEFKAYRVDVNKKAREKGLTVEQAARELRYGIFYDLIKCGAADVVFTAHHALDNAETTLMHMFRGAGLDGLVGMENVEDFAVMRPFLDVYPKELDEYAAANGIEYATDETNLELDADRNYVRLKVIPAIEERYVGAVKAINALSKECAKLKKYMDGCLDTTNIKNDCGAAVISENALISPLAERYVRYALKSFTLTDMTRIDVENAIAAENYSMGGYAELKHGVCAIREYGGVAVYVPRNVTPYTGEKPIAIGANYIDGLAVDIKKSGRAAKSVKGGAVDLDKLGGAVLRFRRDGDIFEPFGSGGTKKLKQYFIDRKIPKRLRDRIPLICRGNEVLVVVGYEISDKVKQTDETKQKYTVRQRW